MADTPYRTQRPDHAYTNVMGGYRPFSGRLINPVVLHAGRDRGVYWERTGGKSHTVTFVREDEVFFRGIPVRTMQSCMGDN